MMAYISISGAAGIIVFLSCITLALFDMEKKKEFQALHVTMIAMGLVYGLIFPLAVLGAQQGAFMENHFILASINYSIVHSIAAIFALVGVYVGWHLVSRSRIKKSSTYFSNTTERKLIFWLYIMTIIALATQYLYTKDYGGFLGYFEVNILLRSGLIPDEDRSSFSFLLPFGGFAIVAFYGFWGLFLSKKRGPLVMIGLLLSGILGSYVAYASAGRVVMIAFLAVIILSIFIARRTNRLLLFVLMIAAAPLVLLIFYTLSNLLSLKGAENIQVYLLRETSYMFVSFFAQLENGELFQVFREVFLSPAFLLPQSLTSSWLDSATDINTRLIYGANKGESGITGSIPTDILTFGLMQFHLVGVFFYAIVFGFLLRVLNCIAGSFSLNGVAATFIAFIYIKLSIFAVFYAYPKHILIGNFAFIVCLLFIWCARILKRTFFLPKARI